MSELKLYGYIISQPVRSVLEYLLLSNIDHEMILLNPMQGDLTSPDFIAINPYESVPVIVHNNYSVWESAAIVPYLADSYNIDNQFYPKDPKIRARINSYLHWHHQNIRDPCNDYLDGKIAGPKRYNKEELSEEQERVLKKRFDDMLEDIKWNLKPTGFIARTDFLTIADIFAFNELSLVVRRLFRLEDHEEIKAWYDNVRKISIVGELTDQANEVYSKILGE